MTNSLLERKVQETLRANRQSLDDINQHIWDTIVLNQLTTAEVAALFTSLMRQVLSIQSNASILGDSGIKPEHLNPEVVTKLQQLMTEEWLSQNGLLK